MKIFLTGATGFIGMQLTPKLIAKGWTVNALVRNMESKPAMVISKMGVQLTPGDVTDKESMRKAMAGADLVIHNAGHYEFGLNRKGRKQMYETNVKGTENVLSLAVELKIPKVVYVSSIVAFGDTGTALRDESFVRISKYESWYERTKTEAHEIALNYAKKIPLIIVCPSAVIGFNDPSGWGYFLRAYLTKSLPESGWGADHITSLVHVDDLATGIVLACEKGRPGETYILGGEPLVKREHVNYWSQYAARKPVKMWVNKSIAALMFIMYVPWLRSKKMTAFVSPETARVSVHSNFNTSKAKKELGWHHRSAEKMWEEVVSQELARIKEEKPSKPDFKKRVSPVQ